LKGIDEFFVKSGNECYNSPGNPWHLVCGPHTKAFDKQEELVQ
jgi:hypothetical protein